MSYTVIWSPAALRVFYELPRHTAMIVDRAVIRLAEHGEGHLCWIAPYHRLRAGRHEIAVRRDEQDKTIYVLFLYLPHR